MAANATAVMVALATANDGGRRWPGTVLITASAGSSSWPQFSQTFCSRNPAQCPSVWSRRPDTCNPGRQLWSFSSSAAFTPGRARKPRSRRVQLQLSVRIFCLQSRRPARCRARPSAFCKLRDDGIVPLICPTCQNVFAGFAQSIHASGHHATLHGVVFDILAGSVLDRGAGSIHVAQPPRS